MKAMWPVLGMVALLAIFLLAGAMDYYDAVHRPVATYSFPPMEAPCRDPVAGKELRIWVDKRISETEGVRTCRVVPLSGDDSPRKAWKKAMKL